MGRLIELLDYTLLKPTANKIDLDLFCRESIQNGFKTVFVQPYWVPYVFAQLAEFGIKVGAPIGFSLGGMRTKIKVAETLDCIKHGAAEIDMLINIGALKSQDYMAVKIDIAEVVKAAQGLTTKVIIEAGLLNREEKIAACNIIMAAGADFVKTSTGFNGSGATIDDVKLIKSIVGDNLQIKAAGGICTKQDVMAMLEAGASRIGTSNAVSIVLELEKENI